MNYSTKFVFLLSIIIGVAACKATTETATENTYIPYLKVAEDIKFWEQRSESPFISFAHFIRIRNEDSYSIYLINAENDKKLILNSSNGDMRKIELPRMDLNDAKNWTLVVDKPEWQVRITPIIRVTLPSKKVRYKDLFVVLKDLNTRRNEVDSMPRWLRQDHYRILFTFQNPSSARYINDRGEQQHYHADQDNTLILTINDEYYNENGWLLFSEMPESITPLN